MNYYMWVVGLSILISSGANAMEQYTMEQYAMEPYTINFYKVPAEAPVFCKIYFDQAINEKNVDRVERILIRYKTLKEHYPPAIFAWKVFNKDADAIVVDPIKLKPILHSAFESVLCGLAEKGGNQRFLTLYRVRGMLAVQEECEPYCRNGIIKLPNL